MFGSPRGLATDEQVADLVEQAQRPDLAGR
jgi:hypothetical protein